MNDKDQEDPNKVKEYDGKVENKIITSMVVNTTVLAKVASIYKPDMFLTRWANYVSDLCFDYYKTYGRHPGKDIKDLISSKIETLHDKATKELLERYVINLSDEYTRLEEAINPDFMVDEASKFFSNVDLERVVSKVEGLRKRGKLEEAAELLASFRKVSIGEESFTNLFTDVNEATATFSFLRVAQLVKYSGGLDPFFADHLCKDGFIAFAGPEKSGKTFWLIDMAFRAAAQRKKVVFFEVGDMSRNQIQARFYSRMASHPFRSPDGKWPCTIKYPCSYDGIDLQYDERVFSSSITDVIANKGRESFLKKCGMTGKIEYLKLQARPTSTVNVAKIRSDLIKLRDTEDYSPEVIVIDYADILSHNHQGHGKDKRDLINATWEQLRSLALEFHCLVVTATQTNRLSYKAEVIEMEHMADDKRKLAHATAVIGINTKPAEKALGVRRLNIVALREGDYHTRRCVYVAGCLPFAHPSVKSVYPSYKGPKTEVSNLMEDGRKKVKVKAEAPLTEVDIT